MPTQAKSAPTMEPDDRDDDEGQGGDALDPAALMNGAVEAIVVEARTHPYRTLGIAFATGYVLGGGVPRFAVRMATTFALRTLGRAILTSDVVVGLARDAFAPREPEPAPARKRTKRAAPRKARN